jgi:hypothetical protein
VDRDPLDRPPDLIQQKEHFLNSAHDSMLEVVSVDVIDGLGCRVAHEQVSHVDVGSPTVVIEG